MSNIFICYRRRDSAHVTGRICDRLCHHFGEYEIFVDVDKMPAGRDFRTVIDEQVGRCEVLLAVIGPAWLADGLAGGEPRLNNPADFVRIEIESALRRGIPVIPLLVDGVEMPPPRRLPESLHDLAFRQGIPIRSDPDFHHDMNRLITALDAYVGHGGGSVGSELTGSPGRGLRRRPEEEIIVPKMIVVPAGIFRMGDVWGDGDSQQLPAHEVHISRRYAIGRFPVTFDEYDRFAAEVGKEPPDDEEDEGWDWFRGERPVINVSFDEAKEYARWLSDKTGRKYRLPSEAEWEYAARSAGRAEKWAGTSDQAKLSDYAWYLDNSQGKTQPVGRKAANGLGLHDMSGNVWEWVADGWHFNYDGAPADGSAWDHADAVRRVIRGGSWYYGQQWVRCSNRDWSHRGDRDGDVGFRLAQDLD